MTLASTVCTLLVIVALPAAAAPHEFTSAGEVTRARDWLGRRVETRSGRELGTVEDFALDAETGRVAYAVVSVGSFLVRDSLIAVDPRALRDERGRGDPLTLHADEGDLRRAPRFSADATWPLRAAVGPADAPTDRDDAERSGDRAERRSSDRGIATISDGERTATLAGSELQVQRTRAPVPSVPPPAGALPATAMDEFARLDRDGDGVLDRAEIAHTLEPDDNYRALDANANGVIEPGEFDALRD